mgnify:CR=1 FL=1
MSGDSMQISAEEKINGFFCREEELKHAYEKFRLAGDVNKPPFDEVYAAVKAYIHDFEQ